MKCVFRAPSFALLQPADRRPGSSGGGGGAEAHSDRGSDSSYTVTLATVLCPS